MVKVLKTEGIVLKKRSFFNQDRLITVLTADFGKINIFAKGIKKITSRRLPHTETGNYIKLVFHKKNENFYLKETSLISAFSKIKCSRSKINCLYYIFFIIEKLLPENQEEVYVYHQCKRFLVNLSEKEMLKEKDFVLIITKILRHLGYLNEELSLSALTSLVEEIIAEKVPALII